MTDQDAAQIRALIRRYGLYRVCVEIRRHLAPSKDLIVWKAAFYRLTQFEFACGAAEGKLSPLQKRAGAP